MTRAMHSLVQSSWRAQPHIILVCAATLIVCACDRKRPEAPTPQVASKPASDPDRFAETVAATKGSVPEVSLANTSLTKSLELLATEGGIPINVEWDRVRAAGISPDAPVETRLHNVRWSKCLDVVVQSVGGGEDVVTWSILPDGVVVVTTREDLYTRLSNERRYPVADLIIPQDPALRPQLVQQIEELISMTVLQESWSDGRKPGARIRRDGETLVVTQTEYGHREVSALLEQLREQVRTPRPGT